VTWEFHPAQAAFTKYKADWDRLNGEFYGGHPYFDSRFVGPLLKYFASGEERLCLYRVQGVVRGALILLACGGGRWATFRPAQAQITPILVADAGVLEELLKALPSLAWTIEFHAVDPRYAPVFSLARADTIVLAHAITIGIDPGIGFENYWNQRSKNLRSNIRRYYNRVEREADAAELSILADPVSMADGVRRFGELESSGWKGSTGTAVSIDNVQGCFYAEMLANFAVTGHAEIYELEIGEQLAASRLLIGNARMHVILKTAYNETLANFAPSRLLLHRLIERKLTEHPETSIEFYTNATKDQAEWATFNCTIQNIQLFRSDSTVVVYTLLKGLKRQLAGMGPTSSNADHPVPELKVRSCTCLDDFVVGNYPLDEFAPCEAVENSIEWYGLLQTEVYPDDPNIHYYFVDDHGRPTVILPLRQTTHGGVRTLESFSNYYTSLYAPLLGKGSDLSALRDILSTATSDNRGVHLMRFAPMDPESPSFNALLNELRVIGWIPLTFFCFGNWFLKVEGGWEDYLRGRSANLRSSIKRRNREFAAEGGTLEVVSALDGLEAAISAFQEVYLASWKQQEPYPNFVPSLIRMLAANGMLRLGIARLHGTPVAAQLWIAGQEKAYIYKVAYHHAYASLSPGTVLTSYLLRHAIEQDRVREVDFLIGDDEYKKIWMSHRRERWGIVAFNPRSVIGCAMMIKEVTGRMAKVASQRFGAILSRTKEAMTPIWIRYPGFIRKDQVRSANNQRDKTLTWTIFPIEKFSEYSVQWDALVRSRPGAPFLESAFLRPLLEVFGTGGERLCVLMESGRLHAAAIVQRGRLGGWQTFQPSQLPLGAWITDGHVDMISSFNGLMPLLPGITLALGASQVDPNLQLRPEDTPKLRTQDYIATAWVDIEGDFDAYWEARGKNLKQNTRKQRNKLQAEGIDARIECIIEAGQVAKAIEDYGQLEGAGWKGADGTAITSHNDQGRFYRCMLENYCALGRGRIYRYWFGDKVVAIELCIHDDMVLVILKTAYDETYKTVSLSTLMRYDQFQQLFAEQKFQRIEFFGKVMEWHTRWTLQSRTLYHATAYRWGWLKELNARRGAAVGELTSAAQPES
jgi:hypothetical protein